jgi:hypothetical protein
LSSFTFLWGLFSESEVPRPAIILKQLLLFNYLTRRAGLISTVDSWETSLTFLFLPLFNLLHRDSFPPFFWLFCLLLFRLSAIVLFWATGFKQT